MQKLETNRIWMKRNWKIIFVCSWFVLLKELNIECWTDWLTFIPEELTFFTFACASNGTLMFLQNFTFNFLFRLKIAPIIPTTAVVSHYTQLWCFLRRRHSANVPHWRFEYELGVLCAWILLLHNLFRTFHLRTCVCKLPPKHSHHHRLISFPVYMESISHAIANRTCAKCLFSHSSVHYYPDIETIHKQFIFPSDTNTEEKKNTVQIRWWYTLTNENADSFRN